MHNVNVHTYAIRGEPYGFRVSREQNHSHNLRANKDLGEQR